MLNLLLLAVHAIPAYVPYGDGIVAIDHEKDSGLVVGTSQNYVAKINDAARWNGLTPVNMLLPETAHTITSWRKGKKGLYLTHLTRGSLYKTYVPGIMGMSNQAAIAAQLNALLGMYDRVSKSPGMTSHNIVDFVVPKQVQDLLAKDAPTLPEIIAVLPLLSGTLHALQETEKALDSEWPKTHPLYNKHKRESTALQEKLEKQKEELEQKYLADFEAIKLIDPKDREQHLAKLYAKQDQEAEEEQALTKREADTFDTEQHRLDSDRELLPIKLYQKHKAEKAHFDKQKEHIKELIDKLKRKIPTFVTIDVAQKLHPSNPAAVKEFIELFLSANSVENKKQIISLLAKIDGVTSLDLSHADDDNVESLGANPAFIQMLTSQATLATVKDPGLFTAMARTISNTFIISPFKDRAISKYLTEDSNFFSALESAIIKQIIKEIAETEKDISDSSMATKWTVFIENINNSNFTLGDLQKNPENKNLIERIDSQLEAKIHQFNLPDFSRTMADKAGAHQKNWEKLADLAAKWQESIRLCEPALERIVTEAKGVFPELKGVFDEALASILKRRPGYASVSVASRRES